MGEERGKPERGFVVIDRRGQEEESSPPAAASEETRAKAAGAGGGASEPAATPLPRIDFSTFVLSLSTSALFHLGLVADPETGERAPKNLALARQTIDTLEVLQEKTQGNLEPDEKRLLESLLYELHLRFVEASG